MFKEGKKFQQKTIFDFDYKMSDARRKVLNNSWAADFFENIFLKIDENKFSVLFSDKYSRPNVAVNLLISLFIIKDLTNSSDEELIEGFYFDLRYHHALGISNIEKEKLCINTLTNFRNRIVGYEIITGIDLLGDEVKRITSGSLLDF